MYSLNPEKKKEATKKLYILNPEKKEASKDLCIQNPEKKREAVKTAYRENCGKHKADFADNYFEHRDEMCKSIRELYVLRAPNEGLVKTFVEGLVGK